MRAVQLAAAQCTSGRKLLQFSAVNGSNFLEETRTGIVLVFCYAGLSFNQVLELLLAFEPAILIRHANCLSGRDANIILSLGPASNPSLSRP